MSILQNLVLGFPQRIKEKLAVEINLILAKKETNKKYKINTLKNKILKRFKNINLLK